MFPGLIISKRGGFDVGGGTWLHPKLAIALAQWCSPTFALQVSDWVKSLFLVEIEDEIYEKLSKLGGGSFGNGVIVSLETAAVLLQIVDKLGMRPFLREEIIRRAVMRVNGSFTGEKDEI